MKQGVSMFLQKIDDWILNRIFEPVAWWSEYNFGVTGMRLFFYFSMVGATILIFDSYDAGFYLLTFFFLAVAIIITFSIDAYEASVRKNNGLNPQRSRWQMRYLCVALGGYAILSGHFDHNMSDLEILANDTAYTALVLALYFSACNAMPPGYRERHLVPHTA